jgi:integrase
MRDSNTFSIQFITRPNKIRKEQLPIYARISVNGNRIEISLKRWIKKEDWDASKGIGKGTRMEIRSLNRYIEEVRTRLFECYRELKMSNKLITTTVIKNKFLGIDQSEHTLCKLIDYHNTQMKEALAWGTMKNYFTTQKYITKFLREKLHTSDVYLSELNYQFLCDFEYYLRTYKPKDHQKSLANNGVMKHLERFRKMTRLAARLGWVKQDPFANYQLKFQKKERHYLTAEELQSIEEKDFSIFRLQWAKELFIFSCYTGLAYIDLVNLTPGNIVIGIDGGRWIHTSRQKTDLPVRVPLLPQALAIMKKYEAHPRSVEANRIFPPISNQKLNSYLKEIADLCKIDKQLTFHLARHTFATTVTLCNGVPIETVSKMLGHSKITTTQIYAKVIEKKVSEDMQKLKDRFSICK